MNAALCVDTADFALHFTLVHAEDDRILFHHEALLDQQWTHSAVLVPLLQKALTHAGLDMDDLRHIYVNLGPGSFTGLRASLSLVRTLGQFLPNLQIYGVNTFQIRHAMIPLEQRQAYDTFAFGIDARRQRQYYACLHSVGETWQWVTPPCITSDDTVFEAQASNTLLILDEPCLERRALHQPLYPVPVDVPSVMSRALLKESHPLAMRQAVQSFKILPTPWQALEPLYLQEPHITPNPRPAVPFEAEKI
ncbi:MAG: tRNA (adenosine(37)-N6)-threonylcarbamoyltransferase complex dimerization subunit type 1 TsaB [Vampirovibrio sp.]